MFKFIDNIFNKNPIASTDSSSSLDTRDVPKMVKKWAGLSIIKNMPWTLERNNEQLKASQDMRLIEEGCSAEIKGVGDN